MGFEKYIKLDEALSGTVSAVVTRYGSDSLQATTMDVVPVSHIIGLKAKMLTDGAACEFCEELERGDELALPLDLRHEFGDVISANYCPNCGRLLNECVSPVSVVRCRNCNHWDSQTGWCTVHKRTQKNRNYYCADGRSRGDVDVAG